MNGPNEGLFARWFSLESPPASAGGEITFLSESADQRDVVWEELLKRVRSHYIDRDTLALYCESLGYPGAAASLEVLVPSDLKARSGELGEILATEFVNEQTEVEVYLKRLRHKDERETALRGDDLIGVGFDNAGQLHVLKGESKSRQSLTSMVLDEAEAKLLQNNGRPSQHSLGVVASYLLKTDQPLGTAVAKYNLKQLPATLAHIIVTLTQSKPRTLFPRRLQGSYPTGIARKLVGIIIADHKATIKRIYSEIATVDNIKRDIRR